MITTLLFAAAPFFPTWIAAPPQIVRGRTPAGPARPGLAEPYLPQGPYGIDTFGYTDPNPPEFHPLGAEEFTAVRLEEAVLVTDSYVDQVGVRYDDVLAGGGPSGTMPGLPATTTYSVAMGDLRGDGRRLIVRVGRIAGQSGRRLRVLSQNSSGVYTVIRNEGLPSFSTVDIACADVDGDGRDEIVLACGIFVSSSTRRHEIWVVDDLIDGPWDTATTIPLLDQRTLGSGGPDANARLALAELDGDSRPEIFAAFSDGTSRADCYAVDDLQANLSTLANSSVVAGQAGEFMRVTAVDSDGDGVDELAVAGIDAVRVVQVSGSGLSSVGSFPIEAAPFSTGPPIPKQPVGWDPEGTGREEVAMVRISRQQIGLPWQPDEYEEIYIESWRRSGQSSWGTTMSELVLDTSNLGNDALAVMMDLAALEDDNDGRDELRGVLNIQGELWDFRVDGDDVRDVFDRGSAFAENLFLVAGDDDGETVEVRWTGRKELNVAAPLPIVVMEAVPTKEGVLQNYGLSGSTFSSGSSTATSYSTTSALSLGMTAGFSTPALFGLLEAEAKATITGTVATTTGTTDIVRTFTTYGSSHDVHSIVFQGTLQHSYIYEILRAADPAAVGTLMALNVPVATNEWKWTLDAFNSAFPNQRIEPAEVFAHSGGHSEIGDPATYPDRSELVSYVTGTNPLHTGWVGGSSTVGEGFAFNGFGLALGSVATTSTERTLEVELGVTFEAAGMIAGASAGVSSSNVYTVETSSSTEYEASIGDLEPSDYPAWNYTAGMVVYQDRLSGVYPFQVIRYWTDLTGLGY